MFELGYTTVSSCDGYFTESNVKSVFGWNGQVVKQKCKMNSLALVSRDLKMYDTRTYPPSTFLGTSTATTGC